MSAEAFNKKIDEYVAAGFADDKGEAGLLVAKAYPALYRAYQAQPLVAAPVVRKAVPARPQTYAERSLDSLVQAVQKQAPGLTRAEALDVVMTSEEGQRLWEQRRAQLRPL